MGALFAIITGFCWAAYNLAVRRGIEAMDSGTGYVITLVFGSLANLVFLLLPMPGRGSAMTAGIALLWFALSGLVNTIVGRWALFRNIALVGPSRASAWKNATPLYTLIFGMLLLGEWPGPMGIAGTAAVVGGLLLLSREQFRKEKNEPSKANLREVATLGIVSGMAFSAAMLFRKAGLNLYPDAAMGNVVAGAAALFTYMPFAVAKGETRKVTRAPWRGAAPFLLAGCFSALAQLTTLLSLRLTMAATTQVVGAMEPIFTMLLSVALFRSAEKVTAGLLASAALVCLGVVLMAL